MTQHRLSDGKRYKGYLITPEGDQIVLPEEAVRDLDHAQRLNAFIPSSDAGRASISQWLERVERDLNIPGLWNTRALKHNDAYTDGRLRLIVRVPTPSRAVLRVAEAITEFESLEGPSLEHAVLRAQRTMRQAALFVAMRDAPSR